VSVGFEGIEPGRGVSVGLGPSGESHVERASLAMHRAMLGELGWAPLHRMLCSLSLVFIWTRMPYSLARSVQVNSGAF
jgi:hypothetical protein